MWGGVLDFILKLAFPKAPTWIGDLLGTAIPAIIELVEAVDDANKTGAEKFEFVVENMVIVRKILTVIIFTLL